MDRLTLEELAERYPALRNCVKKGRNADPYDDFNQTLAACGYRFEDAEAIALARGGGYEELKVCRVVKIIYCI
jgi:hypothetical protein